MSLEDGSSKPAYATVMGVPVVTIPLKDYAALLASQRELAERSLSLNSLQQSRRSVIERNPEVAMFLIQRLGLEPMPAILKACRKEFGRHRTPSRSAAYRYWMKIREEREAE